MVEKEERKKHNAIEPLISLYIILAVLRLRQCSWRVHCHLNISRFIYKCYSSMFTLKLQYVLL